MIVGDNLLIVRLRFLDNLLFDEKLSESFLFDIKLSKFLDNLLFLLLPIFNYCMTPKS